MVRFLRLPCGAYLGCGHAGRGTACAVTDVLLPAQALARHAYTYTIDVVGQ